MNLYRRFEFKVTVPSSFRKIPLRLCIPLCFLSCFSFESKEYKDYIMDFMDFIGYFTYRISLYYTI